MREISIGLIGTGFMGKCHALAFRTAPAVFGNLPRPRLELLADVDPTMTERSAKAFGCARWTTDWRALVADPGIDVVAITTPNFLHQEMALAAIAAGKHVYCEN
jgi:predicted dehydrogenase